MFDYLKQFSKIIVTGPQRAGTRICARMIVHDIGYRFVDERNINIDSLYRLTDALALDNVVVQCPALCRFVHHYGINDDLVVVMMKRDIDDIIASQKRIKWGWEPVELAYYEGYPPPIARAKYSFWEKQKEVIKHWNEVDYESLSSHPLWEPKIQRLNFKAHQTRVNEYA